MSVKITVDVTNFVNYINETKENISEVPEVCNNYLALGMELAEGLAQLYAPVDTGALRDEIHREQVSDNAIALVSNPVNKQGQTYGAFPEFGTSKQPEQPHMRPAVEEAVVEIMAGIKGELMKKFSYLPP